KAILSPLSPASGRGVQAGQLFFGVVGAMRISTVSDRWTVLGMPGKCVIVSNVQLTVTRTTELLAESTVIVEVTSGAGDRLAASARAAALMALLSLALVASELP